MSFFTKLFFVGLCSAGLTLATASDAEAGHRHRHRRGGCCGTTSSCAPAPTCNTGCGASYAAPSAGCSTCNVGSTTYSPAMAPTTSTSPSDMPAGSPPPVPAPPPASN